MNQKGKIMRSLVTAFFLAMALPGCAHAQTPGAGDKVTISGYQIPTPQRIDQPIEWDAVKDHLPAKLYEKPQSPKKTAEIYNDVNQLMQEKIREYEAALDVLANERKDEYPGQSHEDVKFALADMFVTGEGNDISPEVQKLALEYAALQYVHEAFQKELEAQGQQPLSYAPGPVPVK